MEVSQRLVLIVGLSCLVAFGTAIWVFLAGYGLLAAFLTYSLGGSALVLLMAFVATLPMGPRYAEVPATVPAS